MSRRQNTGLMEDLISFAALLPWWAGILLAIASYLALHALARGPVPPIVTKVPQGGSGGVQNPFTNPLVWWILAWVGQYILPIICGFGALVSAVQRRKRKALAESVSAPSASRSEAAAALAGMSWREFELLVGEGFRQHGYHVDETGGSGPDGGIDLVLSRAGEKFLVQCKQWRAFRVGVAIVRELYGVMAARGAAGGFVVTSGRFTDEARAFARGRNIRLIDGPGLLALLRQTRAAAPARTAPQPEASVSESSHVSSEPPLCPRCGKPMVRRVARRGASAGREFWGCSDYPKCMGTRDL